MATGAGGVMVFAEQGVNGIEKVSLQLAGKARQLAEQLNSAVAAILLGDNLQESASTLFQVGVDFVLLGEVPDLTPVQPELTSQILVNVIREYQPEVVLIGSTSLGREIAPLVAARLETGLTAHCIDLTINSARILEQKIPAYGGMITIVCPEKRPQMATVAEGVFPIPSLDPAMQGEVIRVDIPESGMLGAQTLEIVLQDQSTVALESAAVIVAGGAGVGSIDGWLEVAELARTLGAGLASTRPVVDSGWADFETMIGQSGKFVNPDLYIGVGVSGDLQHMVGISSPRVMIAVNQDPKSRIFRQVDFGIVEDCREFIPVLLQELAELRLPVRKSA